MIFSSSTSELSSYGRLTTVDFNHLQTPDLIVDHHYAMFTTTLHKPSYFVMGLLSSTGDVSLVVSSTGYSFTMFPVCGVSC